MTTIRQVKTKKVSLKFIMSRKPFMRGFNDVKKGKDMDYDAYKIMNDQWQYERGRIFGLIYNGRVKEGNRVLWGAQAAYHNALQEGIIL